MTRREGGWGAAGVDPLKSIRGRPIEILTREDVKFSSGGIAVEIFGELGFESRLVTDEEFDTSPDRIVFIGGNAAWHERALDRIRPLPRTHRPGVIVWHSEPLPFPRAAGLRLAPMTPREIGKVILRDRRVSDPHSNARHMRRIAREGIIDLLTVAARSYQAFLAEEGISSELIPVGYHPIHGHLLDLERDIDVLFLGDLRVRRRKQILRRLERDGLDVHAVGSYSDQRYWGEGRTQLLNRAKILLNLPRHAGLLADLRLILGMAAGALVISEPVYLPDPFEPGKHYVEATIEEMPETARRYLADEDARRRITEAGHAFVTQELTWEHSFADLLALAAERLPPLAARATSP
ncbi:MAG: glycosyltransferase family 1 protein [Actinobacteria bacterium]|nr:glycosyltransferase family 1 protein [Actinomycetota bacterium]